MSGYVTLLIGITLGIFVGLCALKFKWLDRFLILSVILIAFFIFQFGWWVFPEYHSEKTVGFYKEKLIISKKILLSLSRPLQLFTTGLAMAYVVTRIVGDTLKPFVKL